MKKDHLFINKQTFPVLLQSDTSESWYCIIVIRKSYLLPWQLSLVATCDDASANPVFIDIQQT